MGVPALRDLDGERGRVPRSWIQVFCDVDLETYNIDVRQCESLVTERTVGIIPVHLFGGEGEIEPLLEFSRSAEGLWLVEDAACGFGARRRGRRVAGTFGTFGAFSFHPRKAITTGEGGMLTTKGAEVDPARPLLARPRRFAFGTTIGRGGLFLLAQYPYLSFNFRMTDIQGALGCAQMARADWILERRRPLAAPLRRSTGRRRMTLRTGYARGRRPTATRRTSASSAPENHGALRERRRVAPPPQ